MKQFIVTIVMLLVANNAWALDYKVFQDSCKDGATRGQKFLRSSDQTKDLAKMKKDCVLSSAEKKKLATLDKSDSKAYGCGAGVALALQLYKQMTLLKSPRAAKIIEECSK